MSRNVKVCHFLSRNVKILHLSWMTKNLNIRFKRKSIWIKSGSEEALQNVRIVVPFFRKCSLLVMTPLFCSSCKILSDLVGEGFSNLDLNLRDERKEQRVCCGGGASGHPLIIIINLLTKRHRSVDRQRRRPRLSNHARHVLPTRGCLIMMRMVSAWKVESQYYDDDDDSDNKVGDHHYDGLDVDHDDDWQWWWWWAATPFQSCNTWLAADKEKEKWGRHNTSIFKPAQRKSSTYNCFRIWCKQAKWSQSTYPTFECLEAALEEVLCCDCTALCLKTTNYQSRLNRPHCWDTVTELRKFSSSSVDVLVEWWFSKNNVDLHKFWKELKDNTAPEQCGREIRPLIRRRMLKIIDRQLKD